MKILTIKHTTIYRYANPVTLGDHRLMLRPRDSHDMRLIATRLEINPRPASLRWQFDVFGNSVAIASFGQMTNLLRFESEIQLEHFEQGTPDCPIEAYAEMFPFSYSADEVPDVIRYIERHYADPRREVDQWARDFQNENGRSHTLEMLTAMTQATKAQGFGYIAREAEGVQTPIETLHKRSGTCRDFALLMMEGARALGLAARFVSGYLYTPPAGGRNQVGGGATHAWVQIYLPGAGWVEFDPTNGIVGTRDLVRVAIVRDPAQAIPIAGSWNGAATDFLGMTVEVATTSEIR
ncbi:MAG TPA: transglutaminase family protein [Candidatus Binataceae bacterium]|nr:transglutaminase family protein [Candidatus Binataceae bacterium]